MIGSYEAISNAKDGLEKLIKGQTHGTVYKFLRRKRSEAKKEKALGLWEGSTTGEPKRK
jgi:rRNA processing protein Krr1/Pno1